MKFAYTIIYVPNVEASLSFFERAFGFKRRFLHESGTYGELITGETTLAFADQQLADQHFTDGVVIAQTSARPLGIEVAFVSDQVVADHQHALQAGATEYAAPAQKSWGQTVSYLRCPDGTLVELCSAI